MASVPLLAWGRKSVQNSLDALCTLSSFWGPPQYHRDASLLLAKGLSVQQNHASQGDFFSSIEYFILKPFLDKSETGSLPVTSCRWERKWWLKLFTKDIKRPPSRASAI